MSRRKNNKRSPHREGEPSETTPNSGVEVPVPERRVFTDLLGKAASKLRGGKIPPSQREGERRRTSRDQS
jgi:hypothetical protein